MDLPWTLLLLLEMMLQITAQEPTVTPKLTVDPPWDGFLIGDKITLRCDAGNNLRSRKYMWKINNQSDIIGEETYIIQAADKSDNGVYKCKRSDQWNRSTPYSNDIRVKIAGLATFMSIEAFPGIVWADQSLSLRCNYTFPIGDGVIYTFYREGLILTEIPASKGTATFELRNVTLKDKGRYRCEVSFVKYPNGSVHSSNYTHVVIKEVPVRITVDPKEPEDGDTITLRCLCTGDPVCDSRQYSFYRNNALMKSDSVNHNEYRIQNASVMDSGWYHCAILSNNLTHRAKSVQVTVKRIPAANPDLHIIPNGRVREGDNLTLTCSVSEGSPPMDFTWYRGETIFHKETSSSRKVTHQIYHFNESIEGTYSCSVFNNMKSAVRSGRVEVKAEVAVSCPSLTSNLNQSVVAVEDKVRFTCRSPRGTPPITYRLYRDQYLLANTTVNESGPGIFIITLQEDGRYSCGAANEMADVTNCTENMHLTVAAVAQHSLLPISVAVVASSLALILLIAFIVCKVRRNKKENSENCNQTGNTPAENSAPPHGHGHAPHDIVYAEVQVKRKTDGQDGDRARRNPVKPDYYVTYASLNHLQTEKNHGSAHGEREESGYPEYRDIYQNVRRS